MLINVSNYHTSTHPYALTDGSSGSAESEWSGGHPKSPKPGQYDNPGDSQCHQNHIHSPSLFDLNGFFIDFWRVGERRVGISSSLESNPEDIPHHVQESPQKTLFWTGYGPAPLQ
jgi:hypothetical protein